MKPQQEPRGPGLVYTALTRRGGWLLVLGVLALVLVLAPALYLGAALTHLRLRRRPDALLAFVVAVPSAVAAAGALLVLHAIGGWGGYLSAWSLLFVHGTVTLAALAAVVLPGLAAAPASGAAYWRCNQWHQERALVGGAGSRREREDTEAARRARRLRQAQEARHTAGKTRRGVDLGDPARCNLGLVQSDRGLGWGKCGRPLRLPMAEVGHLTVLGGTGTGKSEAVHVLCEWVLEHTDAQLIYLNAKEPAAGLEPGRRIVAHAETLRKTSRMLLPGYAPYDAFRGNTAELRQRLTSAEVFTEPYHEAGTEVILTLALETLAVQGRSPADLPELLLHLSSREVITAITRRDPLAAAALEHIDKRSWSGAVQRYAAAVASLAGWAGPRAAGGWSFEDADCIAVDLPTGTEPKTARTLLRWMLRDVTAYLTGPRRPRRPDGTLRPLVLVVEELSACDGDPVITRTMANMAERARGAGCRIITVAQGPSGLGDEPTREAILTNTCVLTFRQIAAAQQLSDLAGTRTRLEASGSYEGHGLRGMDRGSAREQESYAVPPNELRRLDLGEAFVIYRGRAARIAVAMAAGAYGVRELPQLHAVPVPGPELREVPEPEPEADRPRTVTEWREGVSKKTGRCPKPPTGPTGPNREERNDQ